MRILKLLAMGLAGYALYEIGQSIFGRLDIGMSGGSSQGRQGAASPAQEADQRRSTLSGPSQGGMDVQVADDSGTTHRQVVGRGVVRR